MLESENLTGLGGMMGTEWTKRRKSMKPSEMLDRMFADQEYYIAELEAKVEKLEAENFKLVQQRFEQGEHMTMRTLQLALGGQLDKMNAETLLACGYDHTREEKSENRTD